MTIDNVRTEQPDWSVFRKHVENHFTSDGQQSGVEVFNCALFARLPDHLRNEYFDKVDFVSINAIPPCIKYRPPADLTYEDLEQHYPDAMTAIEVNIATLISIDHAHFLNLHPVRYDKVKEEIAQGEIVTPVVELDTDGEPHVGDGRHRIVALFKFGFENVRVLVKESERERILHQLKNHTVRFDPQPCTDRKRKFTIADFIK